MHAVVILLACFGALALLLASSRFLVGRRWAAAGNATLGVLALSAAAVIQPIAANLATYDRPLLDRPVAQVFCERTGSHSYRVTVTRLPGGRMQAFELSGDDWRLEARELSWHGRASDLGLRPLFRLERLGSRFRELADPAEPPAASYELGSDEGVDVWALARQSPAWHRFASATAVASPWWPLVAGGRYDVWLVAGALDPRPANEAAADAAQARPKPPAR